MKPIELPPNLQRHFYAGGPRIAALRGLDIDAERMPEEWIGAVSAMFGQPERGLSRLADGTLVRDAVAADPEAFLGPEHVARYGADAGLLVKLLDAGERLPVHFHPGRAFARDALDSAHGKTEAWIILEADRGATVHVGWSRARRARPGARVDAHAGRAGDARGDGRAAGRRGRRDLRARGNAARDRRRHPAGRAPGADRLLDPARVGGLPADRGAGPPRARLGPRAGGARPRARASEPGPPREGACSRRPRTRTSAPSAWPRDAARSPASRSSSAWRAAARWPPRAATCRSGAARRSSSRTRRARASCGATWRRSAAARRTRRRERGAGERRGCSSASTSARPR